MGESSLGDVRKPNRTHGRCSNQLEEARRVHREFLKLPVEHFHHAIGLRAEGCGGLVIDLE